MKNQSAIPRLLLILIALSSIVVACRQKPYAYVPATVSKEWQNYLRTLTDPNDWNADYPSAGDVSGWEKLNRPDESREKENKRILALYNPEIAPRKLGGVPVLDIKPKGWRNSDKILVFVHGGSYTFGSASSSLGSAALIANSTGL